MYKLIFAVPVNYLILLPLHLLICHGVNNSSITLIYLLNNLCTAALNTKLCAWKLLYVTVHSVSF